jgi:hypothetical protein
MASTIPTTNTTPAAVSPIITSTTSTEQRPTIASHRLYQRKQLENKLLQLFSSNNSNDSNLFLPSVLTSIIASYATPSLLIAESGLKYLAVCQLPLTQSKRTGCITRLGEWYEVDSDDPVGVNHLYWMISPTLHISATDKSPDTLVAIHRESGQVCYGSFDSHSDGTPEAIKLKRSATKNERWHWRAVTNTKTSEYKPLHFLLGCVPVYVASTGYIHVIGGDEEIPIHEIWTGSHWMPPTPPLSSSATSATVYPALPPIVQSYPAVVTYTPTGTSSPLIVVCGGQLSFKNGLAPIDTCQVYNCCTNTWSMLPSLKTARCRARAVILNGCVVVIGGSGKYSIAQRSVEILSNDPSPTWNVATCELVLVYASISSLWLSHIRVCVVGCTK